MIEVNQVSKVFQNEMVLNNIDLSINEGEVFGLIGTNGAGKSTLLRIMSGIIKPTTGTVTIDEQPIYQNATTKKKLFFIPDELYFFQNATPLDMKNYYKSIYEQFNCEKFDKLLKTFSFDPKKKITSMSKGMKKQIAIFCGVCANTKYLYCDETFDGLDPIMRQSIKSLFAGEMDERGLTPIIASHNLREQEDICEHVGILHKGNIVLSKDLLELKCTIQKIECAFSNEEDAKNCLAQLDITASTRKGPLHLLTVKGDREEVMKILSQYQTTYLEIIPLTLEEIFITEMEAIGYDIKTLIMD